VLEECGKKGVKAVIIISPGFKEIGEQGKILEEKIKSIAKSYGIRILGPTIKLNLGIRRYKKKSFRL
jgi:acyl-CoA synthetase (NDP forming)